MFKYVLLKSIAMNNVEKINGFSVLTLNSAFPKIEFRCLKVVLNSALVVSAETSIDFLKTEGVNFADLSEETIKAKFDTGNTDFEYIAVIVPGTQIPSEYYSSEGVRFLASKMRLKTPRVETAVLLRSFFSEESFGNVITMHEPYFDEECLQRLLGQCEFFDQPQMKSYFKFPPREESSFMFLLS